MQAVKFSEGPFNGVKVFSATMSEARATLGEQVTKWLETKRAQPEFALREMLVTQSSDEAYHCVAITAFFWEKVPTRAIPPAR